jgi:hypothetical protein
MNAEQEIEVQELLRDGHLLPAEAMTCAENSSWVTVSVTAAKQFLIKNFGLFDGDIEKEVKRLRDEGNLREAKEFRENNQEGSVEDALEQIRSSFAVDRSGPMAGFPGSRLIKENGEVFLVTTGPALIEPEKGEFPTIATMLSGLLGADQPYFLAWMRESVLALRSGGESGITGKLLVLAGPVDCGKSFVQKYVISPLLGGRRTDPFLSLSGATSFTTRSEYEHWAMADKGASDIRAFATNIKEMVANEDVTEHKKTKDSRSVAAFHRISLSCNDEEKYLNVLPDIDNSLVDKILVLKCSRGGIPEDRGDHQIKKMFLAKVTSELPAFLEYLLTLDASGPEFNGRFGVAIYQNAEIMARKMGAKVKASQSKGADVLGAVGDGVEGTAGELFVLFSKRIPQLKSNCKSPKAFGRYYLTPLVKSVPDRAKARMLDGNKVYTLTGV